MPDLTLTSDITVGYVQHVGDDLTICRAAWQSTRPSSEDTTETRLYGLIRSLVKHRHGTPIEAGFLTVAIHAPLFVLAQFVRHRHQSLSIDDMSFSVESARYREMQPVFWAPRRDRPMVPIEGFKPMQPAFEALASSRWPAARGALEDAYAGCWHAYSTLLANGICAEVARAVLPQATYCHWWMSGNVRAFLNLLSLRTKSPGAAVVSHVQMETAEAASQIEAIMTTHWPLLMRAWNETGRGSP